MAGKPVIEILSHELFVASRRIFGDVFPRLQATSYQKTYEIALPNDSDPDIGEEGEVELTASTKADKIGSIAVIGYCVGVVSFSACAYEGYKLATVKRVDIDPQSLTAVTSVDSYLYTQDEDDRIIISLSADVPKGNFPDGEQPRNRPLYNSAVEQIQSQLYVKDLEYIYICLRKAGCLQGEKDQD